MQVLYIHTATDPSPAADSGAAEHPVRGVRRFLVVRVVQRVQMQREFRPFGLRHLDTRQYAAVIGPVIAVVEHRDVPARADRLQELQQRAGALRKLETVDDLVDQVARVPAYHEAYML